MKITEKVFNVITGEETIIERDETADEKKERLDYEQAMAVAQAETETKASARQAILDRLGITAEEAQLLLGGN